MLESAVQAHFIKQVKTLNLGFAVKVDAAGHRGFPDVLFISNQSGETLYIEFKQDRGRLSEHQRIMHNKLIDLGADVITIRGRDRADALIRALQDNQPL